MLETCLELNKNIKFVTFYYVFMHGSAKLSLTQTEVLGGKLPNVVNGDDACGLKFTLREEILAEKLKLNSRQN